MKGAVHTLGASFAKGYQDRIFRDRVCPEVSQLELNYHQQYIP